ncbi:hypothetical protein [Flavobacterium pedocola]
MKRLFNYLLFLFTALLVSNQLFATSNKAKDAFTTSETAYHTPFEFETNSDVKSPFFAQKDIKDKIELSESETETEDSQAFTFAASFNFFEAYLTTPTFGNLCRLIQNGLSPGKHVLYLENLQSLCIMYCVYRI